MVAKSDSSTELVIIYRLSFRWFSRYLDFEVLQWSKLNESLGTQNEAKNNPELNARTCGGLQPLTSTASEVEGRS